MRRIKIIGTKMRRTKIRIIKMRGTKFVSHFLVLHFAPHFCSALFYSAFFFPVHESPVCNSECDLILEFITNKKARWLHAELFFLIVSCCFSFVIWSIISGVLRYLVSYL